MPFPRRHCSFFSLLLCFAVAPLLSAQPPAQLPAKSITRLGDFTAGVTSVAYSPDGKYLAAGSYEELWLFDTEGYKLIKKVSIPAGDVRSIAFHPNLPILAVGYYQDWATYTLPDLSGDVLPGEPRGYVTGVSFSPNGALVAGSTEGQKVNIVSLADRKIFHALEGHEYPVNDVAFSADGKQLVSVGGDDLRITKPGEGYVWNAETGEKIATLVEHERAAYCANFSADGKYLLTAGLDEKCNIYQTGDFKALGFFKDHSRPVNAALFAADSELVISGAGGRSQGKNDVLFWLRESGDIVGKIEAQEKKINDLSLHNDGKTLAVASADGSVSIWNIAGPLSAVSKATIAATTTTEEKEEKILRVGIIGLDTSHVIAFTKALNAEKPREEFAGCRVVAAYPQGSPDIESSTSRVPGYTKQMEELDVEIVDSIEALVGKVDAVLLETNDGRPHLEQLIPCLKAGLPTFIDKPVAGSLTDAIAIYKLSEEYKVPVFSSSSLRYAPGAQELRAGKLGKITGCDAYSPCSLEETHPDLFWYGIHGVETLFTVMGTGCESVTRASTPDYDLVIGVWDDGRIGTFRGIREGGKGYGGTAFGEKGVAPIGSFGGYEPLLVEVIKFFRTKKVPVSPEETLEIYAFMEAADESKRQDGKPVSTESVMQTATAAAEAKLKELSK